MLRADDIKFTKEGMVLEFADGTQLALSDEIAERIWYAVEEKEIKGVIDDILDNDEFKDISEMERADIRENYIGRAKRVTQELQMFIIEAAISHTLLERG